MITPLDKGTIPISLVHEALFVATQWSLDVRPVLERAHIDDRLLNAPKGRVSSVQYALPWHAVADAMDDEFFGTDSHPMSWQLAAGADRLAGAYEPSA
ncbi:hypothetical protein BJN34_22460 [Cupriavidus necator]|uniref:HTH-type transcriptional regulator AraC-type N-terminal domain-containing protein n=1 Tax=Cupriavidus necator TaxID=106590 RepID=A0A1U9UWP2_CUPNE|nr:AraC family transcriptional regulator ligand-binding domain-containing protein [Cupriavidus necator]AQV96631.1 hypothetical protein BJN34_22460 [Cupriavidus necator]